MTHHIPRIIFLAGVLIKCIYCNVNTTKPFKDLTLVNLLKHNKKANIILFLTDDQDVELGSLNYMPKTLSNIRDRGAEFRHAYVTTPMCCPSRSSLLTGMYVHNHDVFTNKDNCSSSQWQATHETKSYATYLSNAGYRTGYFGKYLNKYNGSYIPPGWREWGGLIMNSKYYNYSINMNGKTIKHGFNYEKDYYTDIITKDSINFLRSSKKQYPNKPVMLTMAFPAPHGPEDSAPQFSHLYFNITTHHTPSYNYAPNPDKQWILQVTDKMRPVHKDFTNLLMTKRLQTLQSVDVAVEQVINELRTLGELENTYIIYTSDHGYHLGQFGLIKGKSFPFEFDVRVPFLIRGPGVEPGAIMNEIVLNIDLAPTFLDIAGIKTPYNMDGRSILPLVLNLKRKRNKWPDTFLIESSGRRETPHLNNKQQETHLLQYSVPINNTLERSEFKDMDNELLVHIHKNSFNTTDTTQKNTLREYRHGNRIPTFKHFASNNFYKYLNNNVIMENVNQSNQNEILRDKFLSMAQQGRSGRLMMKCVFGYTKFPCRKGQKSFCRLDNGRWHKHKCKNSQNFVVTKKEKQCMCFTSDGPIIKKYLMSGKDLTKAKHKRQSNKQKYCYCDDEDDKYIKYDNADDNFKEERIRFRKHKKREEVCHHERMTCFEHNNDHWRTAPKWHGGPFCFCMNANNNTYSCLRTINSLHNFLYCEFTTGFITFYNLRLDPFELQNRFDQLKSNEKVYLHGLLQRMIACKGINCTAHLDTHLLRSF